MRDGGGELIQYRLVMEPRAARRARQVVGSVLDGWPLGGLADDVVSCVSELVANVYEHAAKSATAELLVSWIPGHSLTVEVRDRDSRMPRRRRTAGLGVLPFALIDTDTRDWRIMELAEAGRGLGLVDALCDRRLAAQQRRRQRSPLPLATETADHTPRNCPRLSDRAEGIDTATPA